MCRSCADGLPGRLGEIPVVAYEPECHARTIDIIRNVASVLSVNIGKARPTEFSTVSYTGIDKRPVTRPLRVTSPGLDDPGASGLEDDVVCDAKHHGGADQAIYAYAREDMDIWQSRLDKSLSSGCFGENLTTIGLEVTHALIGEQWRVGAEVVLEVTSPRIPCRTFAGWLGQQGWVKTFTDAVMPGAYLRVIESGSIEAGDEIMVTHKPAHDITVAMTFQAKTTRRELLPYVATADALARDIKEEAARASRR